MLKGVPDADLPEVAGVEEGRPRFASWVAARAGPDGPPLLAYGRVGLGTAAALAVDPEAPSAQGLREHREFPRLMAQLLRSILPDAPVEPLALERAVRDDSRLTLRLLGEDGRRRTDLEVLAWCEGRPLKVARRADRYEVELPPRERPALVTVRCAARGDAAAEGSAAPAPAAEADPAAPGPAAPAPAAGTDPSSPRPLLERSFVVPPSENRELLRTGPDRGALLRMAGHRGRLDPSPERALAAPESHTTRERPLELPFLLMAAILLPFDAWARRRARSASP
jgi:hypothetical protein